MSEAEENLAGIVRMMRLPAPVREYRFAAPERQWRFDFAWPELMVAAEVEGGTGAVSRHTTFVGFESDCHKYNAAAIQGWRVLRFTPAMIDRGDALTALEEVLQQ